MNPRMECGGLRTDRCEWRFTSPKVTSLSVQSCMAQEMRALRLGGHDTQGHFFHSWRCRPGLKARQGSERCPGCQKPLHLWREEMPGAAIPGTSHSPVRGPGNGKGVHSWCSS